MTNTAADDGGTFTSDVENSGRLPQSGGSVAASVAKTPPKPLLLELLLRLWGDGPDAFQALHLNESWPGIYTEGALKRCQKRPDYLQLARIVTYEYDTARALAESPPLSPEQKSALAAPDLHRAMTLYRDGKSVALRERAKQVIAQGLNEVCGDDRKRRRESADALGKELATFLEKADSPGREDWLRDKVRRFRQRGELPRAAPAPFQGKLGRPGVIFVAEALEERAATLRQQAAL